jgi:ABC-type dipeptide/oligopeptide/nickel transport system permease subunit
MGRFVLRRLLTVLAIVPVTVLGLNLLGNALRDVLDPRLR